MADKFAQRIKNIEARLNQLKTLGLSSSSSVSATSKTLTIPFTIVPYEVSYQWDYCGGEYSARINVAWTNVTGLCEAYIKYPVAIQGRRFVLAKLSNEYYDCQYGLEILNGSDDDLEYFNNGGSPIPIDITVEIVATADFTLSYTLRREH